MAEQLTLGGVAKHFSDESEAYKLVERLRWPDGPVCPHCGVIGDHYFIAAQNGYRTTRTGNTTYRRVWKCHDCRKQFSVLVGTIFEDSHIPLSKWLLAVTLMCSYKDGISANELHRTLGITYRAAWFMAHRIRFAMARPPDQPKLQGTVEADEIYIGGKVRGRRGRGAANKVPVVTLVERNGEARSRAMKNVTDKTVREVLRENVRQDTTLMSDQYEVYTKPGSEFAKHETVDPTKGEYVRGDVHTNTAQGYFSHLKGSIDDTYHHVSEQHLDRYLGEYDYRYSMRKAKDGDRMAQAIFQTTGKRLMYADSFGASS